MTKPGICMLAAHAEELPETGWPYAVEPKIDGFRLLCRVDASGAFAFTSRAGKSEPFASNLSHIGKELVRMGFRDCLVDGEVAAEDWNETAKLVRLKNPSPSNALAIEDRVMFHVFDCVRPGPAAPAWRRREELAKMSATGGRYCRLVPQWLCANKAQAQELYEGFLESGYEGAMLKHPEGLYVGKRSSVWLAVKPTKTVDCQVRGMTEGKGKHLGRLGALECVTEAGVRFSVGTGLTDDERMRLWRDGPSAHAGKWLEVRVQASDVATARHPTFMRWREDRDK